MQFLGVNLSNLDIPLVDSPCGTNLAAVLTGEGEMSKILIVDKDKQTLEGIEKSFGVQKHEFLWAQTGWLL